MGAHSMMVLFGLITVGWVLALAFPLVYAQYPWAKSPPGRSVMTLALVIALALTIGELRLLGFILPDWTRSVLYALIDSALGYQLYTLVGVQRKRRKAGDAAIEHEQSTVE